jgi:hypothetical protein
MLEREETKLKQRRTIEMSYRGSHEGSLRNMLRPGLLHFIRTDQRGVNTQEVYCDTCAEDTELTIDYLIGRYPQWATIAGEEIEEHRQIFINQGEIVAHLTNLGFTLRD